MKAEVQAVLVWPTSAVLPPLPRSAVTPGKSIIGSKMCWYLNNDNMKQREGQRILLEAGCEPPASARPDSAGPAGLGRPSGGCDKPSSLTQATNGWRPEKEGRRLIISRSF